MYKLGLKKLISAKTLTQMGQWQQGALLCQSNDSGCICQIYVFDGKVRLNLVHSETWG